MTDTGPPLSTPPSRLDAIKTFIGDLARPFAIIVTSLGAAISTVTIAIRTEDVDLTAASIFIGAVFAGVGALYGVKSWEVAKTNAANAEVAKTSLATTGSTTS